MNGEEDRRQHLPDGIYFRGSRRPLFQQGWKRLPLMLAVLAGWIFPQCLWFGTAGLPLGTYWVG